jgi:hypothetical protein
MKLKWVQEYEPEYNRLTGHRTGKYVKLGKKYLMYSDNNGKDWKYVDEEQEIFD